MTPERLRELLVYNPGTGEFRWRVALNGRVPAGSIAGSSDRNGYCRIKVDRRSYMAHRLAWLYVHGRWPADQIDHRNGQPADNRIANLREATNAENAQNQRPKRGSPSGMLGAHRHADGWTASIMVDRQDHYLGKFRTPEAAHAAYIEAKRVLHPSSPILDGLEIS